MSSFVERSAPEPSAALDRERDFVRLVAENQHRVVAIARGVLRNPQDAEEVAQDAFIRAYRFFESLREADKFRAWVNRIVFTLALNRKRAARRRLDRDTAWHQSLGDIPQQQGRAAVDKIFLSDVRAQIDSLPDKLRIVLVLCAIEDMEASEVAAVLRIPTGTVRSRLHSARKQLLSRISR